MTAPLFILIILLTLACFYLGTGRDRKVLLFFVGWVLITGLISWSGFLARTDTLPPRMLFVILPSVVLVVYFYRYIRPESLDIRYLTALHMIRIPVELVLFKLYLEKQIPRLMTFEGWNYDIVTGVSAVLMLVYVLVKGKRINYFLLRIWNVAGIMLLGIIVLIAILSAPSPIQQLGFEQPNMAILHFPFTWLPGVVVPLVLLSHLLVLRWGRTNSR